MSVRRPVSFCSMSDRYAVKRRHVALHIERLNIQIKMHHRRMEKAPNDAPCGCGVILRFTPRPQLFGIRPRRLFEPGDEAVLFREYFADVGLAKVHTVKNAWGAQTDDGRTRRRRRSPPPRRGLLRPALSRCPALHISIQAICCFRRRIR